MLFDNYHVMLHVLEVTFAYFGASSKILLLSMRKGRSGWNWQNNTAELSLLQDGCQQKICLANMLTSISNKTGGCHLTHWIIAAFQESYPFRPILKFHYYPIPLCPGLSDLCPSTPLIFILPLAYSKGDLE